MQIKDIVLVSPILDISGTSEVARNIYLALFDLGIKVKLVEIPGWSHLKADLSAEVREKLEIGLSRNDIQDPAVIHFYPPDPYKGIANIQGGRVQVNYTVFETDKCPILWRDFLNNPPFNEVWVGADFQVDAYASQGVNRDKMKVMNFGIDTKRFNPNVEPLNIEGKEGFTIGTSLDWSVRKNPQAMLIAYLQEFNGQKDTTFVIKAYTGYGDANAAEGIRQEIAKVRNMIRSNAKILFMPEYLHADLIPAFHTSLDVWFNLSKGEGWDLGSSQSIACGVPVVYADNTAHKVYLNAENSYPVKCSKVPITSPEFLSKNPNFIGHNWWEADVKDARRQLRNAYNDWKDGKIAEKKKAAREMALTLPWENLARKIVLELGKFY